MRNISSLALAVALWALAPGCVIVVDDTLVDETRDVGSFDAVSNEGKIDVEVVEGPASSLVIHCREDKLDQIDTEVVGGELRIMTWSSWLETWGPCSATATVPSLVGVAARGSGDVEADGDWVGFEYATVSGSGDVAVRGIDGDSVDLAVTGSGDLSIAGGADFASVTSAGSGDIDGFALHVDAAEILATGSGDVELHVNDTADVTIRGSGDVILAGEPQVDVHDSGSGDLVLH